MRFLILIFLISSCVTGPEVYDNAEDSGVYSGTATAYDGDGTQAAFVDRVCPIVTINMTVLGGVGSFSLTDSYPNYGHHPNVVTSHSGAMTLSKNNQFSFKNSWAIEETDVQLVDLMTLNVCDSTTPSTPTDPSTGDRGRLLSLGLRAGDRGFIGEYGFGKARGTLLYGVECSGDEFLPLCIYYMELNKL